MRLVFMGNGPFARPALAALAKSAHPIAAVVARPDLPQGKHQRIEPGPIRALADELGLAVFQPPSVNTPEFYEQLRSLEPELLVVADFGQILSAECLECATHGGINLHGSLLPKYRGAAPIAWAIYHGEAETGVSVIRMTTKLDAGGVIGQGRIPIGPSQTTAEVEELLAPLAAELALAAVDAIAQDTVEILPQDPALVTKAPKLKKEDGLIDWGRSAWQIHNQVRAMRPWPVAYTTWPKENGDPVRIQILQTDPPAAEASTASTEAEPGSVVEADGDRLLIQTGEGLLAIKSLQPAGKKAMDIASFLRGNKLKPGDCFV